MLEGPLPQLPSLGDRSARAWSSEPLRWLVPVSLPDPFAPLLESDQTRSLPASSLPAPFSALTGIFFLVYLASAQPMRHVITYYVQAVITDAKILVCIRTSWYLGIYWRISSTSALRACDKRAPGT